MKSFSLSFVVLLASALPLIAQNKLEKVALPAAKPGPIVRP